MGTAQQRQKHTARCWQLWQSHSLVSPQARSAEESLAQLTASLATTPSACSRPGGAIRLPVVSSARLHGALRVVSAARTTPTVCVAVPEPLAARVQGESSTFAH